jgi:hypothetical protein
MTDPTPVPAAAVQIVEEALCGGGEEQHSVHVTHPGVARAALTALAAAGWLHDPADVAALCTVAGAAKTFMYSTPKSGETAAIAGLDQALRALDALSRADGAR